MRELCFANECLPEDRRVRKRLESALSCTSKPGKTGQSRARPGNAGIDVYHMGVCAEDPSFFVPNRGFWLGIKLEKHCQKSPRGTPIFEEKVARCVQISLVSRFSCGARLSCRKNPMFVSRLFRLLNFHVVCGRAQIGTRGPPDYFVF